VYTWAALSEPSYQQCGCHLVPKPQIKPSLSARNYTPHTGTFNYFIVTHFRFSNYN